MVSEILALSSYFVISVPFLYLIYFITKSYQIKRLIQLSKEFNLKPDTSILISSFLLVLPTLIGLFFVSQKEANFIFLPKIMNYTFFNNLFLGLVIIYLKKVRISLSVFYRFVGFPALINMFFFIGVVLTKNNLFNLILLISFFTIFLKNFLRRPLENFTIVTTVSIEIYDYSSRFQRFLHSFDKVLTGIFDNLFGGIPLLQNREERNIHFLSFPLVILVAIASLQIFDPVILIISLFSSIILGNYIYKRTKNSKSPLFTKIYSFLTSSLFIFSLSKILQLISNHFSKNRLFTSQLILKSFSENVLIFVTAISFLKNETFSLFLMSLYTSSLLSFGVPIVFFGVKNTFDKIDYFADLYKSVNVCNFCLFHKFMYFLTLFNYELNRYKFKRDLGIFLVGNCFIFILCMYDYNKK
ncbi:hypothetical protein TUBRATIS_22750 [Tubulinosema ratisbonensis]|uniref:Uncharacterized protein n=1 Tax=Tubulinosema ratisbonensis TaxID=291195 RepID=A0A437AJC0_9MICR|nr:hypothetical protein TUBRATIS_22750 [Tubulinosema ratisbonensis]